MAARTLTFEPIPNDTKVLKVVPALVRAFRRRRCAAVSDMTRAVVAASPKNRDVAEQ